MLQSPKKHLALYLFLSFAIAWAIWIPIAFSQVDYQSSPYILAAALVGAFGPGLAAIIVNFLDRDLDQITDFRQRIYDFKRIRPSWYLIILLIWPVLHGLAIGITTLFGDSIPESSFLIEILSKPNTIPLVVFLYFLQAGVEELGWRGYLQEKLGQRMSPVLSSLLVGVIHTIWHLPLFWVVGTNQMKMGFGFEFLVFIAFVISSSVFSAWCYYGNRHSIMAATLLHTTSNLSFDIFGYSPGTTKHFVFVLLTVIGAGLILIYFQISSRKSLSELETSSP
jgi:membrane protease YdiL (CAAX protease family)